MYIKLLIKCLLCCQLSKNNIKLNDKCIKNNNKMFYAILNGFIVKDIVMVDELHII